MASRVALLMLAAQILSMLGFSTYAALLPELHLQWALSNSAAGLIGAAFFAGYVATVSYWSALTDHADARKVYLTGGLLSATGLLGFALFAHGLWSAASCQLLLGSGVAATYMPGLRVLSDRVGGAAQSRYIAFYTSFFGVGSALSLLLAGSVAAAWGWQAAFAVCATGPFTAAWVVYFGVEARAAAPPTEPAFSLERLFPVAAWRRVLALRAVSGYILGYTVHCLELFGSRAWIVAFLTFAAGLRTGVNQFPWAPAAIAAFVSLCSVPASILGNEAALRLGRRPWILGVMASSGICGIMLGFSASSYSFVVLVTLLVYTMLVMADSATLTAGLVAAAPSQLRGAAIGLYSLAGFAGGVLGPVLFGAALDFAGGGQTPTAWALGFAAIGSGCLIGSLGARLLAREPKTKYFDPGHGQ